MDSLPDELLLIILDYVAVTDFLANLALNMTNRRLHRLTTERLYKIYPGYSPNQFLRTTALPPPHGRPALASYVEEVVWNYECNKHFSEQGISPKCRRLLADTLQEKGYNLTPKHTLEDLPHDFLHLGLEGVDCVWYSEFFLLFVPKVKKLVVNCRNWNLRVYWFETMALNPTCFQQLSSITINGPVCLESLTPVFNLPSLCDLSVSKICPLPDTDIIMDEWDDNPYAIHESKTSNRYNLSHLSLLGHSYICLSRLLDLFCAFRGLNTFTCQDLQSDPSSIHNISPTLDFPLLRACFFVQRKSLHTVVFHKENTHFTWDILPLMDALQCLENMTTLDISAFQATSLDFNTNLIIPVMLGNLPSSLTSLTLTIYHCHNTHEKRCFCLPILETTSQFLRALVSKFSIALPRLKNLAVVNWPPQLGIYPSDYGDLRRQYKERGVEFVSRPRELSRLGPLKLKMLRGEDEGWVDVRVDEYKMPCGEGRLYFSDVF